MRWVRPALTTSANSVSLWPNAIARCSSAGTRSSTAAEVAAMRSALGNVSLLDWPALTWSLGCTSRSVARCARRATTSLTFMFVVVPAVRDLTGRRGDGTRAPLVEHPELGVDLGGGGLEARQRVDDARRDRLAADREVLDGPRRLGTPQRVGGHLDVAHRVVLGPEPLRCVAHAPHHAPARGLHRRAGLADSARVELWWWWGGSGV